MEWPPICRVILPTRHLHHKANTIGSGHAAPDLKFLAQVKMDAVRDAGQILIIGPSTAKTELAKYFRDQDFENRRPHRCRGGGGSSERWRDHRTCQAVLWHGARTRWRYHRIMLNRHDAA